MVGWKHATEREGGTEKEEGDSIPICGKFGSRFTVITPRRRASSERAEERERASELSTPELRPRRPHSSAARVENDLVNLNFEFESQHCVRVTGIKIHKQGMSDALSTPL